MIICINNSEKLFVEMPVDNIFYQYGFFRKDDWNILSVFKWRFYLILTDIHQLII